MPKPNTLICGDTIYTMTDAYIDGAPAIRQCTPYTCNPHRHGSQRDSDWNDGHTNEGADEHIRFDMDLVEAPRTGAEFAEDPNVPREKWGDVDPDWYRSKAEELGITLLC